MPVDGRNKVVEQFQMFEVPDDFSEGQENHSWTSLEPGQCFAKALMDGIPLIPGLGSYPGSHYLDHDAHFDEPQTGLVAWFIFRVKAI